MKGERLREFTVYLLGLAILVSMVGCGRSGNGARYGESVGFDGVSGLSGYGTLRKLFQSQGYRTFTARSLSRSLDSMQVVVWTPDTNTPPSKLARDFFDEWLKEGNGGKTLVYVGRDYNASGEYWKQMVEREPVGSKTDAFVEEMLVRLEDVESDLTEKVFARWFEVDPNQVGEEVNGLRGAWADGIDVSKTHIWTRTQLQPLEKNSAEPSNDPTVTVTNSIDNLDAVPAYGRATWSLEELDNIEYEEQLLIPESEILLSSDDGRPLVFRLTSDRWPKSQIIVICNGAFLTNGGLVPKEHRKLAGRLVDICGDNEKAAFLVSGRSGPYLNDNDDPSYDGKGLEMFTVWPINLIVIHLALLGIIYCFAVFPIFGRPGRLKEREKSDFGQHVEAVGNLLARTRSEDFARERISDYFKIVRKESKHPWIIQSRRTLPEKALEKLKPAEPSLVPENAITAPDTVIVEETKS
jgi:hypothetical protein